MHLGGSGLVTVCAPVMTRLPRHQCAAPNITLVHQSSRWRPRLVKPLSRAN
jgi:hypothetical protein